MVTFKGSLLVNGIHQKNLPKLLEIKMKHEGHFIFNPDHLRETVIQGQGTTYNNVALEYSSERGMRAAVEVMEYLLHQEQASEGAAR